MWSNTFSDFLSDTAGQALGSDGQPAQRRYSSDDVALLERVKAYMADGLTYEDARDRLKSEPPPQAQPMPDEPPASDMRLTLAAQQQIIVNQQAAIDAQGETIAVQRELIAELKADRERLRAEVAELRQAPLGQPLEDKEPQDSPGSSVSLRTTDTPDDAPIVEASQPERPPSGWRDRLARWLRGE